MQAVWCYSLKNNDDDATVSPHHTVVAAAQSSATTVQGRVGDTEVEVMLDSVASISLVLEDTATWMPGSQLVSEARAHVVSATGKTIPVIGCVTLPAQVGPIEVEHSLVVVQSLITPVILGIDFCRHMALSWILPPHQCMLPHNLFHTTV